MPHLRVCFLWGTETLPWVRQGMNFIQSLWGLCAFFGLCGSIFTTQQK